MKIQISADYNGDHIIEWNLPFLPRIGEQILFDEAYFPDLPEKMRNKMFNVWSVDYRVDDTIGFSPCLWIQNVEDAD